MCVFVCLLDEFRVLLNRMRNESFASDKLFKLYLANRPNEIDADAVADADFLCDFARENTHLLASDQMAFAMNGKVLVA